MTKELLSELLARLTGQLQASSAEDEKNIEKLQRSVAEAILNQAPGDIRSQEFVFEKSDLFETANIEGHRLKKISELASAAKKRDKQAETNLGLSLIISNGVAQ